MMTETAEMLRPFQATCAAQGLDLCHAFSVRRVNGELEGFALPLLNADPLGVLVANTRALWPHVAGQLSDIERADPLDGYVERAVLHALRTLGSAHHVSWVHRGRPVLPVQRIAQAAGFADLSPTHLSVHPRYGPWLAFRAVVVFDLPAPSEDAARVSFCAPCSKPCLPKFHLALGSEAATKQSVRARPSDWIGVRDACPVGREWRYGEAQLAYHYAGMRPRR